MGKGGIMKILLIPLLLLLPSCTLFSSYQVIRDAMEFADDNRPVVSMAKHLEYQEKLRLAGEKSENLNRSLNYNVRLTREDVLSHDILFKGHQPEDLSFEFISYPIGKSIEGWFLFEIRLICKKGSQGRSCSKVPTN
jgi:hypothetical protein